MKVVRKRKEGRRQKAEVEEKRRVHVFAPSEIAMQYKTDKNLVAHSGCVDSAERMSGGRGGLSKMGIRKG